MANLSSASKTPISSSNHNSVLLHKWWLIKVENESKLGVGGYVNRETLGSLGRRLLGSASYGKRCNLNTENVTENRVFGSAAIGKRVDNNTLETVDGITIMITGCVHRSHTLSYGFSREVCDHFHSGFPFNWEEYANKKCERPLPLSFNDLPVTLARDRLMSTTRESEFTAFTSMIVKDILKQCSQDSLNQTVSNDVSWNYTEIELDHKQDVDSLKMTEEAHEINSFSVDLGDSKEAEAGGAHISGSLCSNLDPKRKQCDTTVVLEMDDRYPLRHKRMKKNS